jgi:hypothetical protein
MHAYAIGIEEEEVVLELGVECSCHSSDLEIFRPDISPQHFLSNHCHLERGDLGRESQEPS